ncbi:MAG: D-glycero-beta-D-manno-heptose-7-phosphate kinase [Candidatus Eremiobacteraeota bacterium]|nr:D-glycero-beta-D-manno-heptose-7-phosphate kinase [Candidatus Eremiobacteraeota bacterium]
MKEKIKKVNKFKNADILTIGDVMLDKYIWGDVNRISPEAPVQVVEVKKITYTPGGAANVANNIASLSGRARILGIVGDDESGEILKKELILRKIDPILIAGERPTTKKVRVIGHSQQLLRLDFEERRPVHTKIRKKIINYVKELLPQIDCVVISDYAKGLITKELINELRGIILPAGKKLIVDPKPRNMKYYKGASLITPNHKEAAQFAGIEEENESDLIKIGKKLMKSLESNMLITRGEKGMSLFEQDGRITHIPTKARQVYDVTGAGDTVVATVALALSVGADYAEAAAIANYAAGVVVGKVGTATLNLDELKDAIRRD